MSRSRSTVPSGASAGSRTTPPSARLDDRVAAGQRGGRGQRSDPVPQVGDVVARAVEPVGQRRPAPPAQVRDRVGVAGEQAVRVGEHRPLADPGEQPVLALEQPETAARTRSRAWATRASSSATSGTTRLAASVGVEARTSATRSSSGVSTS